MKKTLTFIMIIVFIAVASANIFAVDNPKFVISTATADSGATVSITISIVDNPGIASARLFVTYDNELTLKSITYGKGLGGMTQQPQKFSSPVILNWISAFSELKTDELYATLVFFVSDDAKGGNHQITATYDENDVYNIKEDNVYFEVVNGGVFVNRPEESTSSSVEATTVETEPSIEETTASTKETSVSTEEATEPTNDTIPTQTQEIYPTSIPFESSSESAPVGTSSQQVISTTESTTVDAHQSEITISSSEDTPSLSIESTQMASIPETSTATAPSESITASSVIAETQTSEPDSPIITPVKKSNATALIVVAAIAAALVVVALTIYYIKLKNHDKS